MAKITIWRENSNDTNFGDFQLLFFRFFMITVHFTFCSNSLF